MFCPHCGAEQPDTFKFCDQCGAALPPVPQSTPQPDAPPAQDPFLDEPTPPAGKRRIGLVVGAVCVFALLCTAAILLILSSGLREPPSPALDDSQNAALSSAAASAAVSAATSDTSGMADTVDLRDYLGAWHVPDLDGIQSGIVYTITEQNGQFYFSGEAIYQNGNRVVQVDPVPLTVSGNTAAGSYFDDGWGNHGTILLTFTQGAIRATVTATGGDWDLAADDVQLQAGLYPNSSIGTGAYESPASDSSASPAPAATDALSDPTEAELTEAFARYLNGLVAAINQGDFSLVASTMVPGSEIYTQQQALVADLSARGVQETIQSYAPESSRKVSDDCWHLQMEEYILVSYLDGTSKVAEQHFTYVLERQANGEWLVSQLLS